MKLFLIVVASWLCVASPLAWSAEAPLRFGIVGLVHDHARGFIPNAKSRPDIKLVAIVEPDRELAQRYAREYKLDSSLFYTNLQQMLDKAKVQAVATFTSTFDHRRVVEACATHGVHVMMEKPLAVNMEDARAIESAAKSWGIQVVVNYETTWYPANQAAYGIIHEHALPEGNPIGDLRKIVVHDGHQGPKEIGCSTNFLEWLTDPVLNGGGALTDFGCYGADLITWLMKGQRPTSVLAVTQQIKPDVYPKVEDEATIVLTYPHAQGIIQASWNWPYNRKDMEIYGKDGYLLVPEKNVLRMRLGNRQETEPAVPPLAAPDNDPLTYLAAVVRGDLRPSGLSSLEVNLIATEILDAARRSAETGTRVTLVADTTKGPSPTLIAQAAMDTYIAFIKDANARRAPWSESIPESFWAPTIRALKPAKVYHRGVNVVIVEKIEKGKEEGFYFWSHLSSSLLPESGTDGYEWLPWSLEEVHPSLGKVLRYARKVDNP